MMMYITAGPITKLFAWGVGGQWSLRLLMLWCFIHIW
jgi:hypothetical protein